MNQKRFDTKMETSVSIFGKQGNLSAEVYRIGRTPSVHGILVCAPFGGEYIFCFRYLVSLIKTLCESGMTLVRFDYRGYGDSHGQFQDSDTTAYVEDTLSCYSFLQSLPDIERFGIIGVRTGAAWALKNIEQNFLSPDWIILVDPIVNLHRYLDQALRSNVAAQTTSYKKVRRNRNELVRDILNGDTVSVVGGFSLAKAFYTSAQKFDVQISLKCKPFPILLTNTKPQDASPSPETNELIRKFSDIGFKTNFKAVPGPKYWDKPKSYFTPPTKLSEEVQDWLKNLDLNVRKHPKLLKVNPSPEVSYAGIDKGEDFVEFRNRLGHRLPGILHHPVDNNKSVGVFLVEVGIGTRVGVNGMNTGLAREFAKMGYLTLRVDLQGMGDAQGDWGEQPLPHFFEKIEAGLFRSNFEDVMSGLADVTNCRNWYLIAHCGAATTIIQSCHSMENVIGAILVEMPFKPSFTMNNHSISKASNFRSWVRFLSGKSDYKNLIREVLNRGTGFIKQKANNISERENSQPNSSIKIAVDKYGFNQAVISGFRKAVKNQKELLLVWCESSVASTDFFKSESEIVHSKEVQAYECVKIPQSNHTFFLQDSQKKLTNVLKQWLAKSEGLYPDRIQ